MIINRINLATCLNFHSALRDGAAGYYVIDCFGSKSMDHTDIVYSYFVVGFDRIGSRYGLY